MKSNRKTALSVVTTPLILVITATLSAPLLKAGDSTLPPHWSVQVDQVQPGDVSIGPEFRIAIYENLLDELAKTKQFKEVLRSGEHRANDIPDLLVLKTAMERYTPGSETRRAVTTFSGATKLTVRAQLSTRDGQIILERELNGNVRFIGDNLRATHNLAHNIAAAVKQSSLPELKRSVAEE